MSSTKKPEGAALSRDERWLAFGAVGVGVIMAGLIIAVAASHLVETFAGGTIRLVAPFVDESAELPIGPDGTMRTVEVEQATITAPDTPLISVFALVAQVVVQALAMLTIVACLTWLCLNIARTRVFAPANEHLLGTCALASGLAWGLTMLLNAMSINGAFASISDRDYNNVLFEAELTPLIVTLVFGVLAAAFRVGARLQKDTEGLV